MADRDELYRLVREKIGGGINLTPEPVVPHDDLYFQNHYNTPIPSGKQQQYEKWAFDMSRKRGSDITKDNIDYDVQGAALAEFGQNQNGHMGDQFKKPNHPTFSDQSQYSGVDGYVGGHWSEGPQGTQFTPSKTNQVMWSPESRERYFQQVEPNVRLIENIGGTPMNINIKRNENGR